MKYRVLEINDRDKWESILKHINPNTFLQSWEWGQVQKDNGEGVIHLGIYRGKELRGAALVILVKAKRGCHYLIPHGPIFNNEEETWDSLRALVDYLSKTAKKDKVVALKIAPLIVDGKQAREKFKKLKFMAAPVHVHAELTWVLDIARPETEIWSGMRKTTRHAIVKAQKAGVQVEVVTDAGAVSRFMPLYRQTKSRHDFVPFSRVFIVSQWRAFAEKDRVYAVMARYQNKDVAAAILMQYGDVVFYHHGASAKVSNNVPASQLVQWTSIREAKRRGAKIYNFWGIAPENNFNHPFAGITVFKKGFGGRAIDYMHAQDLPLSIWYWKLRAIDTWRKWRKGF